VILVDRGGRHGSAAIFKMMQSAATARSVELPDEACYRLMRCAMLPAMLDNDRVAEHFP
jgi:hypothetical protein